MCSHISWCFGRSFFINHLEEYINTVEEDEEKNYFKFRLSRLMKRLEQSTKRSSFWYHTLSALMTTGSIMVPSLIAVQEKSWKANADSEEQEKHEHNVYWIVWAISLSVTLANAFIKLLSLDKTYITRNLRLNQFRSETMKYITKTGPYATSDNVVRFNNFVKIIENMREQQILEEYTPNQNIEVKNTTFV